MTAQLSYQDKVGYYGLRVAPTYDQMLQSIRKEVRIPQPSRAAKWYATGIYRSFLLDAADKFHDYQQQDLEYDQSGAQLPSAAARGAEPSTAGRDEAWKKHDEFNISLSHQEALDLANQAMEGERRQQAASTRRQQLSSYGPSTVHPTLEAHHQDLEYPGVPHPAPVPKLTMPRVAWPTQPSEYIADGQPQAREFPTFEQLNLAQDSRYKHGKMVQGQNQNYQQLRENYLA